MMRRLRDMAGAMDDETRVLKDPAPVPDDASVPLSQKQLQAISFILAMGKALHVYGSPAHRLEDALGRIAHRLGLKGQFFSTPTSLFAAFGDDEHQRTFLVRVEPGEVNLEKLCLLDEILERVASGELPIRHAIDLVQDIVEQPRRYGHALTTLCFGIAPAGASVFFGGGWREAMCAGISGLLIGLLAIWLNRFANARRLFDIVAGFTAAAIAVGGACLIGPLSIHTATLAGVIILVPGLTLTVAMNELATRHLASGTARLMGALTVLMSLGFGVALGFGLQRVLPVPSALESAGITAPLWLMAMIVVVTASALTVLFQARPVDLPWIVGGALLAFLSAKYGSAFFGPYLGVALGSFALASASNGLSRWRNRPTAITMLPGLILLVPGSLGFHSLASLLEHDVVSAVDAGFSMLMLAVSIVAGIFVAGSVVPPRKAL